MDKISAMHRKQLLTLACAAGILAGGACFLPPPRPVSPPPPPPPNVQGVHQICVIVTNISDTQRIDPAQFGRWITQDINDHREVHWPRAHLGDRRSNDDAELRISIAKELATPDQENSAQPDYQYSFHVNLTAALVKPDGTVLWKGREQDFRSRANRVDTADPLQSHTFAEWVRYDVAYRIVDQMLF